jgi:hypothetical protein
LKLAGPVVVRSDKKASVKRSARKDVEELEDDEEEDEEEEETSARDRWYRLTEEDTKQKVLVEGMEFLLIRCYYMSLTKFGKSTNPNSPDNTGLPSLKASLKVLKLPKDFVKDHMDITTGEDPWVCIGCKYQKYKSMYILSTARNATKHALGCAFRGLGEAATEEHISKPKDFYLVEKDPKYKYLSLLRRCAKLKNGFLNLNGDGKLDWNNFISKGDEPVSAIDGWNALKAAFVVVSACYAKVQGFKPYLLAIKAQQIKKEEEKKEVKMKNLNNKKKKKKNNNKNKRPKVITKTVEEDEASL